MNVSNRSRAENALNIFSFDIKEQLDIFSLKVKFSSVLENLRRTKASINETEMIMKLVKKLDNWDIFPRIEQEWGVRDIYRDVYHLDLFWKILDVQVDTFKSSSVGQNLMKSWGLSVEEDEVTAFVSYNSNSYPNSKIGGSAKPMSTLPRQQSSSVSLGRVPSPSNEALNHCHAWNRTGLCPRGDACQYTHDSRRKGVGQTVASGPIQTKKRTINNMDASTVAAARKIFNTIEIVTLYFQTGDAIP